MRYLFLALVLSAAEAPAAAKTLATGEVLALGTDARSLAMGEATLASDRGRVSGLSRSPLGLAGVGQGAFAFSHAILLESIALNHFAYGRKTGPVTVGFAVTRLDYGSLEQRDAAGALSGGFHPKDTVLQGSVVGAMGKLELGLSLKWLSAKIVETGTAFAGDLAARYPVSPEVTAAVAVRNLGSQLEYEAESAPLPAAAAAGLSWKALDPLTVNLDVERPFYAPVWIGVGAQYALKTGSAMTSYLRGGVNTRTPELGGLAGFHTGLGVEFKQLALDYSFDPFGKLGNTHRMSLEYRW